MTELISVEDFLALKDWNKPILSYEGEYKQYKWVQYRFPLDALDVIKLEAPIRLICTKFDSGTPAHLFGDGPEKLFLGDNILWRKIDEDFVVTPPVKSIAGFKTDADYAVIGINGDMTDQEISNSLKGFDDEDDIYDDPELEKHFWEPLFKLDALFYFNIWNDYLFLSRDVDIWNSFCQSDEFKRLDDSKRRNVAKQRKDLWKLMGPECGPEDCAEEGCSRKRIERAVRCFIHQLKWS